jgi:hypothetical protein
VDAVDAEIDQLVDDRRLGAGVAAERHPVEEHLPVDHVDADFRRFAEMSAEGVEYLRRLLDD